VHVTEYVCLLSFNGDYIEFLKAFEVDVLGFAPYEESCVIEGLRQSNFQLSRFYKKGVNTGSILVL
jgi:hypothetical protein